MSRVIFCRAFKELIRSRNEAGSLILIAFSKTVASADALANSFQVVKVS